MIRQIDKGRAFHQKVNWLDDKACGLDNIFKDMFVGLDVPKNYRGSSWLEIFNNLPKPNDGLVPVSSVESQGYFHSFGHSKDCHTNLLGDYEYGLARNALLGKK